MTKGLRPKRAIRNAMAHEILMYGVVQKDGLGLDRAVEEVKARMGRYQVTPNMLIVPPQLLLYMATAPEEKIKYIDGGNLAVTRFEEGTAGYEARNFRGLGIFTSSPYEVNDDSDNVQLLQRSSQVGEFYKMLPPPVWDSEKRLPGAYMDIMVYDEEADQIKHIEFEQAFNAAVGGLTTRELLELLDWENARQNTTFTKSLINQLMTSTDQAIFLAAHPDAKAFGATEQTAYTTLMQTKGDMITAGIAKVRQAFLTLVKAGAWLPICVTIARPFIEHQMMSAIAAVSGRDTGATLFGPADMQLSANTSVKTIEGHYTCHTKSVITKPQNVCVLRDIMCSAYTAGGNTKFFCTPEGGTVDLGPGGPLESPEKFGQVVRNAIESRLNFEDENADYASMLAFVSSYKEESRGARDQVMSISQRVLPWDVSASSDQKHFPGGDAGYTIYKLLYGLDMIHHGEDQRALQSQSYMSQGSANNALCFIGPHRRYNPYASNFFELIPGQGHFGPDAIPGDCRWRRGESVSLKAARDSMVSLEVAAHSQLVFGKGKGV